MKKYLKYGLAVVALGFIAAPAFSQYVRNPALVRPIPQSTAKLLSTARFTRFDPAVHGFRFLNYFSNVTGVFDITTGGLCGGMVYTMLDYFKTGRALPQQDYTPVSGTALERHIYARQMNSLGDHMDKWVELHGNPFGARNSEFFNWGLQGFGGGRLQELRAKIDAGEPVPLGLKSLSADPSGDHVVLAYGYDMGRYRGDLGANKEDLKIFIYDPNAGNQRVTMIPKPATQEYCFVETRKRDGSEYCWRTYFVQQNYRVQTPPNIAPRPNEMIFAIETGGDDLRGGGDNLSIRIRLRSGASVEADNVNLSQRWMGSSWHDIGVTLPASVRAGDVTGVDFKTAFRGGFDGDNWNFERVRMRLMIAGAQVASCERGGTPLIRMTGDTHVYSTVFPC